MLKCFECGHIFEHGKEKRYTEPHGEEYLACPICGGAYEETVTCSMCGGNFHENELFHGLCAECIGEYMTPERMKEYLQHSKLEEDFYIGEMYESSFTYVSPELLELAKCAFNKNVFNSVLIEVEQRRELPKKYESHYYSRMRDFIFGGQYEIFSVAEWINDKEDHTNV